MEIEMWKLCTALAALIVIAAGLAFTAPGHRALYGLGVTAACNSDDGC